MNKTALSEVEAFLALAKTSRFGLAARELGVAQSTMSRRIAHLEARLGQRLVMRTTRRVTLTDAGAAYADELRDVLARLAQADARLQNRAVEPEGLLRVSMPTAFGRVVVLPAIARLASQYPGLRFEVDLSDRYVDLLDGHFDIAIRLSEQAQSGVKSEQIGEFGLSLCMAPAYAEAHGRATDLDDLHRHAWLVQHTYAPRVQWQATWQGRPQLVHATPRISVSDSTSLRALTLSGAGLAVLPSYLCAADLASGALLEALPGLRFPTHAVYAAYLAHRMDLAKVTALLDEVRAIGLG